jgi:Protein of unknown function (DUF3034)
LDTIRKAIQKDTGGVKIIVRLARWLCVVAVLHTPFAFAGDRLQWTGAVTEVEGAGGGGIVPWALIGGLGSNDQLGVSGFVTYVSTQDFTLRSGGVSVDAYDRLEVSYARQRFDASSVIPGLTLGQDIVGAKVRLFGDAVFDTDRWWPQVSAGALWKRTLDYDFIPKAIGAERGSDVEFYVAATKMYFAAIAGHNALVNVTLRRTRADQFGLLGFGGDSGGYKIEPETSALIFLTDNLLLGAEYRQKPSNLTAFKEDSAADAFIAYSPLKNVSFVVAWADLGHIAGKPAQQGYYLSFWMGY